MNFNRDDIIWPAYLATATSLVLVLFGFRIPPNIKRDIIALIIFVGMDMATTYYAIEKVGLRELCGDMKNLIKKFGYGGAGIIVLVAKILVLFVFYGLYFWSNYLPYIPLIAYGLLSLIVLTIYISYIIVILGNFRNIWKRKNSSF